MTSRRPTGFRRATRWLLSGHQAVWAGTSTLEYPIGNKRYETPPSIRFPRVSRDGARIAFLEDTYGSGEGGHVSVLNLADNSVTVLTRRLEKRAWSRVVCGPTGDLVYGRRLARGPVLYAVKRTMPYNRTILHGRGRSPRFDDFV